MANNRSEIIRRNLHQFKILDFCVREIDLEYEETVEKEELEQRNLFMKPQMINQSYEIREEVIEPKHTHNYSSDSSSSGPGNTYGNINETPEHLKDPAPALIKPMKGFSLGLDLSKVQTKGGSSPQKQKLDVYKQAEQEMIERSSVGKNSEQAHPLDGPTHKPNESNHYDSDDSSSSGYGFVPPPELNPNIDFKPKVKAPAPGLGKTGGIGGLGGLGFKLNLTNVPNANLITKEDKSRQEELKKEESACYNNSIKLNMSNPDHSSPEELKKMSNTTKNPIKAPKIPGFGGLGGGFKLDLAKVPTANVITDEDEKKRKELDSDVPVIPKNNFTDLNETKGSKPKKLNLKNKDGTTKVSLNEISMPNLKTQSKHIKKMKFNRSKRLKKRNMDDSMNKTKESRNLNVSKMKSLIIENSEASSLFESATESDENKVPVYKRKSGSNLSRSNISQKSNLTPSQLHANASQSQISRASDGGRSNISNGSYVGSNRVFVPSLNIQDDVINKEIEDKQKHEEEVKLKREKDKKNPRFQMKRMSGDKNMKNLMTKKNNKLLNIMQEGSDKSTPQMRAETSSKEF